MGGGRFGQLRVIFIRVFVKLYGVCGVHIVSSYSDSRSIPKP